MSSVLLATCSYFPEGEPGAEHLDRALRERGVDATWVRWDDPTVDWSAADLVVIRSTWDYEYRPAEFLSWVDSVGPALLNGADTVRWNLDKAYLVELAGAGLPVVPTTSVQSVAELRTAVAGLGTAVVKPRTGAGGRGVRVVTADQEHGEDGGPWIVQPVVESVHTTGEVSVYVFDGAASSRLDKRPGPGEIRVHEEYGGTTVAGTLDADTARLAVESFAVAGLVRGGAEPAYGRADLMWWEDRWVLGELELVEPGLYLDVLPANADPFAAMVVRRLGGA
ncbi:MAG: ATP-grasp domain-containing protein [Nocardioides sp.]